MTMLLFACDGADYENGSDEHCYFIPQLSHIEGGDDGPCSEEIRFVFSDETGQSYEFTYSTSNGFPAVIFLPKNHCYEAEICHGDDGIEIENSAAYCGEFFWDVIVNDEVCFTLSSHVEERPNPCTGLPKYTFCLDDECSCPDVTQH